MPRLTSAFANALARRRSRRLTSAVCLLVAGLAFGGLAPAEAEGTGTISGTAFEDVNRDGAMQAGEAPFQGHRVYLYDGNGTYLAYTTTDASGRYAFGGLADGAYRVEYAPQTWFGIREALAPTTTGTVRPTHHVSLAGQAVADFGWRPIVTSTDLAGPISEVVTETGLQVASYNDVITAQEVADALAEGRLLGDEATHTTVRFAYGTTSACATGVAWVDGAYEDFHAWCHVSYDTWLDGGDSILFHEYGHAWGYYHAYIVQQDPALTSYLEVRGLSGDSRLGTSHAWSRHEILAEDYRTLFGSPNARLADRENRDIPPAAEVAGLEEFLATTFRTPPPDTSETTAPPPNEDDPAAPPAPSAVQVADLDGRAGATAKGQWRAEATVSVRDDTGAAVDGALVAFSWVGARGEAASVSCTTDGAGACQVSAAVKRTTDWVSFSVVDVVADGLAHTGTDNADPDGDSDGTTVVVARLA